MSYTVEVGRLAFKQLKKLPKEECKKIQRKIDSLALGPKPKGFKKIQGEENLFRIRSGDYRILYRIFEKRLVILVVSVGHRKDIYRTFDLSLG